jgi:hypothetical protein
VSCYSIRFFLNGKTPTRVLCEAAADKARRGELKPVDDHFCGIDPCKAANGGCRIRSRFGVACLYAGTYTWPKS